MAKLDTREGNPVRSDETEPCAIVGRPNAELGMTPQLFEGVAEMYRYIGSTPLGEEFPESRDRDRTFIETIQQLAQHVPLREEDGGQA